MEERMLGWLRGAARTTVFKRRAFFLFADILLVAIALDASFWLRFDGDVPDKFSQHLILYVLLAIVIKIGFLALFGQYNITWRFYSLSEASKLMAALILSTLTIIGAFFFVLKPLEAFKEFPRSVLLVDFILCVALIGGLRIAKRSVREYKFRSNKEAKGKIRLLIVGAGQAGEQIIRETLKNRKSRYYPVGLIDDDPAKLGVNIHGVKVLGSRKDIPEIMKGAKIEEVLVAIPSVASKEIREIVEIIRKGNHVKSIKILPSLLNFMDGDFTLSDIQEIKVEDLLGRESVTIDYDAIRKFLQGKRVLITGAGGSIGSELTRTVQAFQPKKMALLDIDETELFNLKNQLKPAGFEIRALVGDIRERTRMEGIYKEFRPEIVIHAAAYKHVPMMEDFPEEAVKTNIHGTRVIGELAVIHNVDKFINISTDKAVNPTSIMGATKRVAEEFLRVLDRENGTRFVSVRFGNVLGSRGSVIPLFKEQIKRGGPVTVTHPDMKRYFMAPAEAVLLVLSAAAASGGGGEAYVLDMGRAVKIVDLARDMIRLSGYEPDVGIPIIYTGLRPGEKLFEELLGAEEGSEPTDHPKIFRAKTSLKKNADRIYELTDKLIHLCQKPCKKEEIVVILKKIVPTYELNGEEEIPYSIPRVGKEETRRQRIN